MNAKKCLEVGCFTGYTALSLTQRGFRDLPLPKPRRWMRAPPRDLSGNHTASIGQEVRRSPVRQTR